MHARSSTSPHHKEAFWPNPRRRGRYVLASIPSVIVTDPHPAPPEPRHPRVGLSAGARAALPVAVAVAGFGISFGVLARAAGFDPLAAVRSSSSRGESGWGAIS
jgi:hypothetical protein